MYGSDSRPRPFTILFHAAFVAVLARGIPPLPAQGDPRPPARKKRPYVDPAKLPEWAGSWADGREKAAARRKPLVLVAPGAGRKGNLVLRLLTLLPAEAKERAVWVVADPATHPVFWVLGEFRSKKATCNLFRRVPCGDHRAAYEEFEDWFRGRFRSDPDPDRTSMLFFFSSDGDYLFRLGGNVKPAMLAKNVERAALASGRGSEALEARRRKYRKAFRALQRRLRRAKSSDALPLMEEIRDLPLPEAQAFLFGLAARAKERGRRLAAVRSLGAPGNYAALPVLKKALAARNLRVQRAAVDALGVLGVPEALPPLLAFASKKQASEMVDALALALARCGPDSPKVERWFLRIFREGRVDHVEYALGVLSFLEGSDALEKAVKDFLHSREERLRRAALLALRRMQGG